MKRFSVLIIVLVLAGMVCADTTTGLVGWWKMDETSGTDVIDSSGNGYDGSFNGSLAWTGGSLDFTGGNVTFDSATVDDIFSTVDRAITISFWVNLDDEAKRNDMYGAKGTDASNAMEIGGMNGMDTWCYMGAGSDLMIEWGTNVPDHDNYVGYQGNWRLVTLVKDADGGELTDPNNPGSPMTGIAKLYINGVAVVTATANPSWHAGGDYLNHSIVGSGIDTFNIGGTGSVAIDGEVRDFRLYDRALTDADVLELAGTDCDHPQCLYPADGQGSGEFDMLMGIEKLHWLHGARAVSYDIFLGTDETAVTNATVTSPEFMGNIEGTVADGDLNTPGVYFWRIDAIGADANDAWSSDISSFTIDGPPEAVDPIGWWKMDQTEGSTVIDYSGNGYDAEKHSSVVWDDDGRYPSLAFTADYVPTQVLVDVNTATEMFSNVDDQLTIAFWVRSDSTSPTADVQWLYKSSVLGTPGTSTYGSILCEYPSYNAGWWHMGRGDKMTHYGSYFDFISYWTHWIISKNTNTGMMKLYKNGELVMTSPNKTQSMADITYWSIGCGSDISQWRWFNGNMRDFRIYDKELPDFQIEEIPGEYVYVAKVPNPADGAEGVEYGASLSWQAGKDIVAHDVYLGESAREVKNADVTSPCYMGQFATNSYEPNELPLMKTYYWRIDEIDDEGGVHKGDIWSFSTIQYIMVEDFESYADDGNDITAVWVDVDTSGAGDMQRFLATDPAYPVLSPVNSMRLRYRLTAWGDLAYYAKTSRTFSPAQDWTAKGVKLLTVNYYGDGGNFGLPMFVTVGDGTTEASISVDANTLDESWNEANVSLPEVAAAGVDLTNVSYMEIGFGDGTNQGSSTSQYDMIYVDDIALYPPKCVLSESTLQGDITEDCVVNYDDLDELAFDWLLGGYTVSAAGAVSDDGLVLHYDFENNTVDSVAGNNGTLQSLGGTASYDTGHDGGKCIHFNASATDSGSNMIVPPAAFADVNEEVTFSLWLKNDTDAPPWYMNVFGATSTSTNRTNLFRLYSPAYMGNMLSVFHAGSGGNSGWGDWDAIQFTQPETFDYLAWNHLALVKNCYNGEMWFYANGELMIHKRGEINKMYGCDEFKLGSNYGDGAFWPGCIDDFRVYNRALSHAEVLTLAGQASATVPISMFNAEDSDVNDDAIVDFKDYSVLAGEWLVEDLWP